MGCAASVNPPSELSTITHALGLAHRHPRETRILQVEEVDTCKTLSKSSFIESAPQDEIYYKYVEQVEGEWRRGLSAGGSRNNVEMFASNPQFLLVVGSGSSAFSLQQTPPIPGTPSNMTADESVYVKRFRIPVFISLSQVETKRPLHIAFFVYKTESTHERLEPEYFLCVSPEVQSGVYVNTPEVQRRCWLWPGLYVVVAAAFHPHHSGSFRLVARSDRHFSLQPLEETDAKHNL